ncbi:hypothetical protein LCGC14_0827800 [marine sediment metagenome]|uniref:RING-type domain-containing protein n=1 Tax=marine sediment metagenome TaxID=412755 RepID=A0A0F9Q234_9ZZZZ|nr:MAG: hypothetical protein Lokiarch_38540 [Candidatus Lokiarchaeum sp. GC14_75]
MPSCIVCHLQIEENNNVDFECDNGHHLHKKCLADWLLQSQNCPLCSDPYSQKVLSEFTDFMEAKKREKQLAIEEELRKESIKKMEEVTKKVVFLKYIEEVEKLLEIKNFDDAIEKLMESYDERNFDEKNLTILFLLGKINFLRQRFDLSINFLFKLVKLKFDYPDGFLYLGKSYEALGMKEKADWAYDRVHQ